MAKGSILIIGAGPAGLAAADELASAGLEVTILEAQNRIGGRVHTIPGAGTVSIELGAEFLHGEDPELWNLLGTAKLPTHKVPEDNWVFRDGVLRERSDLWETYGRLIERVDMSAPDEPFASFLERQTDVDTSAKAMITDYVEGFNAADATRISVHALVKEEQAEESHATSRVTTGYGQLIDWLRSHAQAHGAVTHLNTIAKIVHWGRRRVQVGCLTQEGLKTFCANAALITLPLGVLQKGGAAGLSFDPELSDKAKAAARLEMGNVVKIILQFRSRFWPMENFGFIHAPEERLRTWWVDERGPILTGWVGGPKAMPLLQQTPEMIVNHGVETLARIFPMKTDRIRELLQGSHYHNWARDPYSFGAYSYVPAGSVGVPEELARPVANTIFFAGEATAPYGEQGTVGSAIASGRRAARECLAAG